MAVGFACWVGYHDGQIVFRYSAGWNYSLTAQSGADLMLPLAQHGIMLIFYDDGRTRADRCKCSN
jgi:hypothetical protein